MEKELIRKYEGFYTGTVYANKCWSIFVNCSRTIEPMLKMKAHTKGDQIGDTDEHNFRKCYEIAKSEAKKAGGNIEDIEAFYASLDPIYGCLNTLLMEWKDGHNQVCEYKPMITSKYMQY